MVKLFLSVVLMFSSNVMCEESGLDLYKKLQDYIFTEFSNYNIQSILPIPKSYTKTLEGKNVDSVVCRSKGSSNLYLYLDCDFLNGNEKVSSFPVTARIKEGSNIAIEKNKKITILYIDKNIKVGVMGVALQSGKIGDYIEVKNISTGKVLKGKVISENEVLVQQ